MDKLKMHSVNKVDENIKKIAELFPNTLTEVIKGYRDDGTPIIEHAIDFDVLRQEMSDIIVEGPEERYQFTWPDKKKSILLANAPIAKTLRPCREESVDFDTTENLYIEGDNLDALKLLQETYLGKVKMIYIDPPYNTGKDFIYEDDFAQDTDKYLANSGQFDEDGNRLVPNLESNGRFHTDWLNMMYPRLKLAKDLLRDDGVIFISIDDNEVENLRKVCDEVFGEHNFIACLPTIMNLKGNNDQFGFAGTHEYTLVFAKNKNRLIINEFVIDDDNIEEWEEDEFGYFKKGANLKATGVNAPREKRPNLWFPIYITKDNDINLERVNEDDIELYPITNGQEMSWRWSKSKILNEKHNIIITRNGGDISIYKKQRPAIGDLPSKKPKSIFYKPEYSSGNGTEEIKNIFEEKKVFNNPKPLSLIKDFVQLGMGKDSLIIDFLSGSATTAHAVMQLNAEDGGNRKFIMVQFPEKTPENSEAYKAGYKTISEIGKERIRRAGKKILEEHPEAAGRLDIGFRVLKVASSNMQDVYYRPDEYTQDLLAVLTDNIKPDRTPEDLLFQVMLDLGVLLSSKIEEMVIGGKKVFSVADGYLMACFDKDVTDEVVREIAKKQPYYAVFRDSGMASDSVATNFEQIFETYSPSTVRKVL